jgi:hypothetical protein
MKVDTGSQEWRGWNWMVTNCEYSGLIGKMPTIEYEWDTEVFAVSRWREERAGVKSGQGEGDRNVVTAFQVEGDSGRR